MQQYPEFFVDSNTAHIDLTGGHWVEIKSEMSIGDWERYEASMLQIEAEASTMNREQRRAIRGASRKGTQAQSTKMTLGAGYLDLLLINIMSWSFDGVPLNRDSVSKLRTDWAQTIIDAIDRRNPEGSPLAGIGTQPQTSATRTSSKEEQDSSTSTPSVT